MAVLLLPISKTFFEIQCEQWEEVHWGPYFYLVALSCVLKSTNYLSHRKYMRIYLDKISEGGDFNIFDNFIVIFETKKYHLTAHHDVIRPQTNVVARLASAESRPKISFGQWCWFFLTLLI